MGLASPYVEEYDWISVEDDSIIVDDWSEGFSLVNGREHQPPPEKPCLFAYIFFREPDLFNPNLNQDLPSLREALDFAQRGEFSLWFRESERTSHGTYYPTYASNPMGTKESQPQFVAKLPSTGRWLLDFHVPSIGRERYTTGWKIAFGIVSSYREERRDLGIHRFEINLGNTTELDLSEVPTGWNQLGIFETSSQDVRVTLVEVTDGVAIADAVRWTPVE